MDNCPFCQLANENSDRIVATNELAFAMRDGYPLVPGHTLIIPKRHEGSFFKLLPVEQNALIHLLTLQKEELHRTMGIDDFNIGINDGPAAGQTIHHCHIHLIPRRSGDMPDPRGGVRWIFPDKADYWSQP